MKLDAEDIEEACTACGVWFVPDGGEVCERCMFAAALREALGGDDEPIVLPKGSFGSYILHEVVGRGGMGVVWRATHRNSGKVVALKMIASPVLGGEAAARRFHAEIEAAGGLEHPNLVPMHESGESEGHAYYTMRYLDGALPADCAPVAVQRDARGIASLMANVADAIEAAHRSGVLHRDLKPGNVLVTPDGTPYVMDFGLARRLAGGGTLTGTGSFAGTPAYMAPEQVAMTRGKGDRLTVAADVYGLGALLYALLCGCPPFAGSVLEILRQVADTPPLSVRQRVPAIPRDLEAITMKCLEKQPRHRYGTAGELRDDLRCFLEGRPVAARPIGALGKLARLCRRRPWQVAAAGAGLAGLCALGFSVIAGTRARLADERRRESEAAAARLRSANYAADMLAARMAIDQRRYETARKLAAAQIPEQGQPDERGLEWRLLMTQLSDRSDRVITGVPGIPFGLSVTPDGKLACVSGNGFVSLCSLAEGKWNSMDVPAGDIFSNAAVSDDGSYAAASTEREVWIWNAASRELIKKLPRYLEELKDTATVAAPTAGPTTAPLVFQPGTNRLFASGTAPESDTRAVPGSSVWDVNTMTCVWRMDNLATYAAYTPDGNYLYTVDATKFSMWSTKELKNLGGYSLERFHKKLELGTPFRRFCGLCATADSKWISIAIGRVNKAGLLVTLRVDPANTSADTFDLSSEPVAFAIPNANMMAYTTGSDGLTVSNKEAGDPRSLGVPGHTGAVTVLSPAVKSGRLISAATDLTLRIWGEEALRPKEIQAKCSIPLAVVHQETPVTQDARMVVCKHGGQLHFMSTDAAQSKTLAVPASTLGPCLAKDGSIYVFQPGSEGSVVRRIDSETLAAQALPVPVGLNGLAAPFKFAISSDGVFAAISHSQGLIVWRLADGKTVIADTEPALADSWLALSPDGAFAALSRGPGIRVIGTETTTRFEWSTSDIVTGVTFSGDGAHLACTFRTVAEVGVFDLKGGAGRIFDGLKGAASHVAFTPDGKSLIACSDDAHFWSLASGRHLYYHSGRNSTPVLRTGFSRDGSRMLLLLNDGKIDCIELPPGRL